MNEEDQAFPHCTFTDKAIQGLTKREYFAAKAMAAMMSNPNWKGMLDITAVEAFRMADLMLVTQE